MKILETNLTKALQKYYTRKGNKIVFLNGMTLNQLSWEMWERLEYQGIDPSVLSRVVNGSRLFTFKQLKTFSKILAIPYEEQDILERLLLVEVGERYGFKETALWNEVVIKPEPWFGKMANKRSPAEKSDYFESLIRKDPSGEGSIEYWKKQDGRFWKGEFREICAEIEDLKSYIKSRRLDSEKRGKLWLTASIAIEERSFTHQLSPPDLIKGRFSIQERPAEIESILHSPHPLKTYAISCCGALVRITAEAMMGREGTTEDALKLLINSFNLHKVALKTYSREDGFERTNDYTELMAIAEDIELFFPDKVESVLGVGEKSVDFYKKALETSSALKGKAKAVKASTHEFKARWNLRKILMGRKLKNTQAKEESKLYVEAFNEIKKSEEILDRFKGEMSIIKTNTAVTKVNMFRVAGENVPMNVMTKAVKLVMDSGDMEQGFRLLSGD